MRRYLMLAVCLALIAGCSYSAKKDTPAIKPLAGKVIVLDPGHNGGNATHPKRINRLVPMGNGRKACNTVGTSTNDGYAEHAFTYDVALRAQKILLSRGAKVTLTRPTDTGVGPCVNRRAKIGNRLRADAVVSIHGDGGRPRGRGFHVIQPAAEQGLPNADVIVPSHELALSLRATFLAGTGEPYANYIAHNGLDARNDLGGLNLSTVPVAMIECGNMRNARDAAWMRRPASRQKMALAIADGISRYIKEVSDNQS